MANETKACRDIGALLPAAQAACRAFLRECEREGLDVLITETYRTQDKLFVGFARETCNKC